MRADAAIETRGLTKDYGPTLGVDDLTLTVPQGRVFGFLGPNGAGKSTTIRLLLDLIRPTRGTARVLGLDAREDAREIHARVGYLPGDLALHGKMTGREILALSADLRGGVDPALAHDLAERFRLDLDRPVRDLSKGNRQKVGLVHAFHHAPELVILDEPTSGLDPLMQSVFNEVVLEWKRAGRTVFLSSHVLPEVEAVCDRVAIIRDGRLVTVEDVDALKARAVRRLDVHFADPVPADAFAGVPGVQDVTVHDRVLSCTIQGSLDAFVKAIARHEVVNVVGHEPRLEDVFFAHYDTREREEAA